MGKRVFAIVKNAVASMHTAPMSDSELSDEPLHGMIVEVLSEHGEWVHVRTHYYYTGYIEKSDLCFDADNTSRYYNAAEKHVIAGASVDILARPDVRGYRLLCLARGAVVIKTDYCTDGWRGVVTADGSEGYVREGLLADYREAVGFRDISDSALQAELRGRLVDTALGYMGVQYRWGGKTPSGIDCSGLTSMSYLLNGVIIYRDAGIRDISEGYAMRRIPGLDFKNPAYIDRIGAGDLIFFPGHVAMYIGGGRYVHSSPINEGVGINSLIPGDPGYHADLAGKVTDAGTIFTTTA